MKFTVGKSKVRLSLQGRIDSGNSAELEKELMEVVEQNKDKEFEIDMSELNYISSAGLRVLLKLRKLKKKNLEVLNVNDEVFEIFNVTGFSEMFNVSKKLKILFLQRSDVLMRGVNGVFYKQSNDTMIKVYRQGVSIDVVRKEREQARKALILGIPTLIPYEIGMVGACYGIVYEAVQTTSLAKMITKNSQNITRYASKLAEFIKEIHEVQIRNDEFPNIKERYRNWLEEAESWLSENDKIGIQALIEGLPDSEGYVHGNINLGNIAVNDDEFMLLDMAASAHGAPIFDLQNLYATMKEIPRKNPTFCSSQFGISAENSQLMWEAFYNEYMRGSSEGAKEKMSQLLQKYYILNDHLLSVIESKQ